MARPGKVGKGLKSRFLLKILFLSVFSFPSEAWSSVLRDPLMKGIYVEPSRAMEEIDRLIVTEQDQIRVLEYNGMNAFASYILADPKLIEQYSKGRMEQSLSAGRLDLAALFSCVSGYRQQLLGNLELAKVGITQCLEYAVASKQALYEVLARECLAFLELDLGNSREALNQINEGMKSLSPEDLNFFHHIQNSKGVILNTLNYHEDARKVFRESIAYFREAKADYFLAVVQYNLITAIPEDEQSLKISTLEEIVELNINKDNRLLVAYGSQMLGIKYLEQKRFDDAIRVFTKSKRIFES